MPGPESRDGRAPGPRRGGAGLPRPWAAPDASVAAPKTCALGRVAVPMRRVVRFWTGSRACSVLRLRTVESWSRLPCLSSPPATLNRSRVTLAVWEALL